jgi:hypothetical protein
MFGSAVVPMMNGPTPTAFAATAVATSLLSGSAHFGFFFRFDFLAEFFVFGTLGFAAFAFVVDLFDRHRLLLVLADFVVGFRFVVFIGDGRGRRGEGRQAHGVSRGGCGQQHQRGEQEYQQDREVPHAPCIGGPPRPC